MEGNLVAILEAMNLKPRLEPIPSFAGQVLCTHVGRQQSAKLS